MDYCIAEKVAGARAKYGEDALVKSRIYRAAV
jgi:hypothetical protein